MIFAHIKDCILNVSVSTMFSSFISFTGVVWRNLSNITSAAERLQVQSASVVDFKLDLFNKHVLSVSPYTGLRFQGDATICQ